MNIQRYVKCSLNSRINFMIHWYIIFSQWNNMPMVPMLPTLSTDTRVQSNHVSMCEPTNIRRTNVLKTFTIPKLYKMEKFRGKNLFKFEHTHILCIRMLTVMLYARLNKVHCSKTTDALRTEATGIEIHMDPYTHLALNEKLKAQREKKEAKNKIAATTTAITKPFSQRWIRLLAQRRKDDENRKKWNINERIDVSGWNEKHQILLKH